jgi:carbamate kinase
MSEAPEVRPLAVVAIGGNALLPAGGPLTMEAQRDHAAKVARSLAPLSVTHRLVITHGSGPQVGILAQLASMATSLRDTTLDVIDAEIEGMMGYVLMQALANEFAADVATLLTQVVVSPLDDAFVLLTKPIGPVVTEAVATQLSSEHGWCFAPRGDGFRRLVASPAPIGIVELPSIRALIDAGVIPVCAGGGGIPVVRTDYQLAGIEAVVDKDFVTSLLARELKADLLVLLTDVDGLLTGWGNPHGQLVRHAPTHWARALVLEPGSMGPKVLACCDFADATGKPAFIGSIADAEGVVAGRCGTRFDQLGTAPQLESVRRAPGPAKQLARQA